MRRGVAQRVLIYGAALGIALFTLFPLYWMVLTSLKGEDELYTATPDFWPDSPDFGRYLDVLTERGIAEAMRNSLVTAGLATVVGILFAALAGYALARFDVPFRRYILLLLMVVQMMPVVVTLIPLFIQLRDVHLLNSLIGLAIVYVGFNVPLGVWLMREYLAGIPPEMEEATLIDGGSRVDAMFRVVLPMALPGLAATALLGFIAAWSEFLFALSFVTDGDKQTLPVAIAQNFTARGASDETGIMVASTLYTLPVVILFVILRRNLTKGVAVGAVKG
jgi:ABC-type glycerol-3-phosphate transport system permease component